MKHSIALFFIVTAFVLTSFFVPSAHAQFEVSEPEVITDVVVQTPFKSGLKNGLTLNLLLTDFGFGVGGQYRRVLGNYTDAILDANISVLRDVKEQTFVNFFGQQTTPNKYNRILSFPINAGLRHRFFAESIKDNFRFYVLGAAGPVAAFIYPYFDDSRGLGVRLPDQFVYDVFDGWSEGYWDWGFNGKVALGIDLGSNFRNVSSIEMGYHMNYFPGGIQVMEPNSFEFVSENEIRVIEGGGFDRQNFFGTVMIKFMFGGMW
ncbi:MAG: hypothetical protein ACNA8K_02930 [Cyclonatronaceae bacterium]